MSVCLRYSLLVSGNLTISGKELARGTVLLPLTCSQSRVSKFPSLENMTFSTDFLKLYTGCIYSSPTNLNFKPNIIRFMCIIITTIIIHSTWNVYKNEYWHRYWG